MLGAPIVCHIVSLVIQVASGGFSRICRAVAVNRFFSAVVRIQRDRGHTVVDGGPYRFVRHPGYAGSVLNTLAVPFALGALLALLPAGLVVALIIWRTALEDRTLRAELDGYAEYATRVRSRLLPRVW